MAIKYLTEILIHHILQNTDSPYTLFVDLWLNNDGDGFYTVIIQIGSFSYIPVTVRDQLVKKTYITRDNVLNSFVRDDNCTAIFRTFDKDDFLSHKPYYEMSESEKNRWDKRQFEHR